MEAKTKETNKLIKWSDAGYPPIDMNNEFRHIISLIKDVRELTEENERLKKNKEYISGQRDRREEQNGILRGQATAMKSHADKLASECMELEALNKELVAEAEIFMTNIKGYSPVIEKLLESSFKRFESVLSKARKQETK